MKTSKENKFVGSADSIKFVSLEEARANKKRREEELEAWRKQKAAREDEPPKEQDTN